jgi:hypothetical protein
MRMFASAVSDLLHAALPAAIDCTRTGLRPRILLLTGP